VVICPKCGNEIPAWKLIFLTNFNTVTCSTCLAKLQANKKIGSLIGGIGGGVGGGLGGLLIFFWFDTKEMIYLMLLITVFPILFLASLLASIKFMKLEVKS
jgi:hypothetical protein